MRSFKVITDPKAMELLGDETRRRVIYLLRGNEMSVSQLASQLDKTPQAIYHQIKKLNEAGLVEVAREQRIGHLVEAYYRATAEIFQFTHGSSGSPGSLSESQLRPILKALTKLGLAEELDDQAVGQIVSLQNRLFTLGSRPGLEHEIEKMEELDFLAKQGLLEYAKMMSMADAEFQEFLDIHSRTRAILRSTANQRKQQLPPRTHQ